MRKSVLIFVALAILVGTMPVSAQGILRGGYVPSSPEGWYYLLVGDRVSMLQADNIDYIRRTMNIGRRAQVRRVTDDLVGYGDYVGLRGPKGFYPMYQCASKGRRWERGIGTTAIGIGLGYVLGRSTGFGGKEGAIVGGVIGGGYALYKDASCQPVQNTQINVIGLGQEGDDEMVVQSPISRTPQPPGRENGWNDRLRDQSNSGRNPWFGSYRSCMEQGMATLKNDGRNPISVYQDGVHYLDLLPRRSECGDPRASYEAEVLTMVVEGYAGTMDTARRKPEGRDGLVLVWR